MDYRFGPFRMDTARRRLWRGEELVPLTPKAFDTLLALVRRPGSVVEKDEILRTVWPDTFVEEATLAQNISTLRRALGDTAETPIYIATVPRRGYRFLEKVDVVSDAEGPTSKPGPEEAAGNRQGASVPAPVPAIARPVPMWRTLRTPLWLAAGVGAAVALIAIAARVSLAPGAAIRPVVFAISPADGTTLSTSGGVMSVAPDGRHVAFVALGPDGVDRLWLRALDSLAVRVLPGTEGATQPFWSPDSRFVAFFAEGKLKKAAVLSGPTEVICEAPAGVTPLAGTWNAQGGILFSAVRDGIYRVQPETGAVTTLLEKGEGDDFVGWPQFLPDGRHFLYVVGSTVADRPGIYVGSLDSTGTSRVTTTRSFALFASSGHLLFVQDGSLVAQPFDPATRTLHGTPAPIAEGVAFNAGTGRATFSVSQNGVLAYRNVTDTSLIWFDRSGKSLDAVGPVGGYLQFSLSPDDSQVAAARLDPGLGTSDIWIIDVREKRERRLTFGSSWETSPLWSPDGLHVAFGSQPGGRWEIHEKQSDGNGPDRRILSSEFSVLPEDWTRDGRVVFRQLDRSASHDFWLADPRAEAEPLRVASGGAAETSGRVSPDGQWLAYVGYEPDPEIYIRSLTSNEPARRVSSFARSEPRWRGDGRELFYLSRDMCVMSVELELAPAFRADTPRRLFQTHAVAPSGLTGQAYDVSSDGRRFLVKVPAAFSPITVVVGWTGVLQSSR